jgi:aminoglycoside phosphotransferase family enzyme/predicted kinase
VSDAARPAVAETHSAVVFFLGDHAYKLKKPIDLGFLDFRTREAREAVCDREVALNRRLAPDVYEGVAEIVGPDGAVCDHLVVMRRMPTNRRLSSLVLAEQPVQDELWKVAKLVAGLHERSERSPAADAAASLDATRRRWGQNTDQLIAMGGRWFDDTVIGLVHGLACRYLDGRSRLFDHRIADGRAVDGHGDLLADDIFCLPDGPRILDCIEFDDTLRLGDGLADASFLAMDLERLGRADLGRHFLDAYGELLGDVWPASLAHHHIAHRAQIRAKVTALRAEQGDPDAPAQAVNLLNLAASHLERGRVRLVLVGGLPGTGKSTLAQGLADRMGCTVLRSDELRHELAGVTGHAPADHGAGIYSSAWTNTTYEHLLDRARIALELGETVILDASWIDPTWRERARALATSVYADLVQLRCDLPGPIAAKRIAERATVGSDPSDATPAIAAAMAKEVHGWPDAATIDTSTTPEAALEGAVRIGHLTA